MAAVYEFGTMMLVASLFFYLINLANSRFAVRYLQISLPNIADKVNEVLKDINLGEPSRKEGQALLEIIDKTITNAKGVGFFSGMQVLVAMVLKKELKFDFYGSILKDHESNNSPIDDRIIKLLNKYIETISVAVVIRDGITMSIVKNAHAFSEWIKKIMAKKPSKSESYSSVIMENQVNEESTGLVYIKLTRQPTRGRRPRRRRRPKRERNSIIFRTLTYIVHSVSTKGYRVIGQVHHNL